MFVGHSAKGSGGEGGQYAAVLIHMEHLSTTSKNAEIKRRTKFIAVKMRDVHFAAFCHFLKDLFSILSKLNLQMQLKVDFGSKEIERLIKWFRPLLYT